MNKKIKQVTAIVLTGTLLLLSANTGTVSQTGTISDTPDKQVAAFAPTDPPTDTDVTVKATKDETVYVLSGADGSVNQIIVSDWLKNTNYEPLLNDVSELQNIENVKGDEEYSADGNALIWNAAGNDIYYQGSSEKELPVTMSVSYSLDGAPISPSELAGKSGKVTIRFDYQNNMYELVDIDGKQEKIYVPFAMLTGLVLDNESFRNIQVSNGKLINDGDRTFVVGIAFPGLQEDLAVEKEKLDIPSYVEITADVTGFEMDTSVTIATNALFSQLDSIDMNGEGGNLFDSMNQLTDGMSQLLDGSSQLYDGVSTLLDKVKELQAGVGEMEAGAKKLKDATAKLDAGMGDFKDGVKAVSDGLNTLAGNNSDLIGGAKQVFLKLLDTARTQLNQAGLSVPELTIENYADVLNNVINSLDETAVYNSALEQVTQGVEAKRSDITAAVTAAVREQVATQLIPLATGGQMTKETYDAAKAANALPPETIAQIEGAIDQQMQSADVQAKIAAETDNQVEKAISQTMASDEVQAKLKAASEGAKSVIELKASLDSYNAFYLGLISYTDGVAQLAGGMDKLTDATKDMKSGTSQIKDGMSDLYDGVAKLNDSMPALVEGVSQLNDGAMQLSDGLQKFNDEGISKITELVDGDLLGILSRTNAIMDVSKHYNNYSGMDANMDGQVKFIFTTEEIAPEV